MRYLTADWVLTANGLERDTALVLDQDGFAVQSVPVSEAPKVERMEGILCSPFVNAHCHLELSHLFGILPKHTGMTGFVSALTRLRHDFPAEAKAAAASSALKAMWDSGIGAIGDICNTQDTLALKHQHPEMRFHTFAEVFGRNPANVSAHLDYGLSLEKAFAPDSSLVPHAPYSMSAELIAAIYGHSRTHARPITVHLLESEEERELFETGKGPLMEFLQQFFPGHPAPNLSRPQDHMLKGAPGNPYLLVHMTELQEPELNELLAEQSMDPYFVLCPGANEYINGKLPPAEMLGRLAPDRVCLGTDSLASNTCLDLLFEMKLLQKHCAINTAQLLRWATENGRRALRLPPLKGLVQIGPVVGENATFTEDTTSRRIA